MGAAVRKVESASTPGRDERMDPEYYFLLRLAPGATPGEIEDAYPQALERARTRLGRFLAVLCNWTPERVEAAYRTLSDPVARAAYDRYLKDLYRSHYFMPMF